ncbi:hypothetical protein [Nocardiopsis dassonvillei]|uniref:hypothetical protein n=1 Tax=Nocardiopsis dassonvillei TaxID=2014 RepID=UPI00362B9433
MSTHEQSALDAAEASEQEATAPVGGKVFQMPYGPDGEHTLTITVPRRFKRLKLAKAMRTLDFEKVFEVLGVNAEQIEEFEDAELSGSEFEELTERLAEALLGKGGTAKN